MWIETNNLAPEACSVECQKLIIRCQTLYAVCVVMVYNNVSRNLVLYTVSMRDEAPAYKDQQTYPIYTKVLYCM